MRSITQVSQSLKDYQDSLVTSADLRTKEEKLMDWMHQQLARNKGDVCERSPDQIHEYVLRVDTKVLKCRFCGTDL